MRKFRGILSTKREPLDKELIWHNIKNHKLLYFNNGSWLPLVQEADTVIVVATKDVLYDGEYSVGTIAFAQDTQELYVYNDTETWVPIGGDNVVVSYNEPDDETALWFDPAGDAEINEEGNLSELREEIAYLRKKVDALNHLLQYGAVAGNSKVGGRTQMMSTSNTQIQPEDSSSDEGDSEDEYEPIVPDNACTIPNISIKMDTSTNFMNNKNNLIDGEPIFITDLMSFAVYYKGSFIVNSGGGGNIDTDDTMTEEELKELLGDITLDKIQFESLNGSKYNLEIDQSGDIHWYVNSNYDGNIGSAKTYGSYINDYLKINTVFLGGVGTKLNSFCACSHNFVELANGSTSDTQLNGIYLLYKGPDKTSWESIALKGTIKAGSTYLIRGARCSYSSNVTIDVPTYDQEWFNSSGNLIEFEEGGGTFYLVCSQEGKFHNGTSWVTLDKIGSLNPYSTTATPVGYIDLLGVLGNKGGTVMGEGGSPIQIKATEDIKRCIFSRAFPLDPCSQAQKAYASKKSSTLATYINLDTTGDDAYPYYDKAYKWRFMPKSSKEGKSIYGTRTTFDETKPNAITITFGIQATDAGTGATKCFNWISVGDYDEYLEYKDTDGKTHTIYSIDPSTLETHYKDDGNVREFIDVYKRIHWLTTNHTAVTTHKVILRNLTAGNYSFRICREGDESYKSEWKSFNVKSDSQVANFAVAHTTDQQAFNFYEYQAWTKSVWAMCQNFSPNFTINTGDATQNGNRENEWLDYFAGRDTFLEGVEEMYSIGNNDLCGTTPYELGDGTAGTYKINHKNIMYYFCFELDTDNPAIFKYVDSGLDAANMGDVIEYGDNYFTYYMPSLYSFNYGDYHFTCLNSEFATNTYKCYYNDSNKATSFKAHAFYNMYKWMQKDYERYGSTRKNVVYCHEIPFCITVADTATAVGTARTATSGSKLNEDFSAGVSKTETSDSTNYTGGCCFSEFFQNHAYKLCLGGHKHTYSLSYPTYENITVSGSTRTVDYDNPSVNHSAGVTYLMSQATGYKLVSNKELPGSGIKWLKQYYPATTNGTTLTANEAQYYPMFNYLEVSGSTLKSTSYAVTNVYTRNSSNKPVAFDINNQNTSFSTDFLKTIDNTNITITY
jgi:hypothetical protein